jgi:TRAP-type C4-dicarboxylate transport system permease small subunit
LETLPSDVADAIPPPPTNAFDRALSAVENWLVVIAGIIVFFLMLYGTADVLSRWLFNRPLPSTYEYMELGMVAVVYLGVSQVQRLRGHIAVDLVNKYLPVRLNEAVEIVGCLFGLVLMGAIGWWGAAAAWSSYLTGEYIGSVARVHVLPARIALLAGVAVLFLRLCLELTQHFQRLLGRNGTSSSASSAH